MSAYTNLQNDRSKAGQLAAVQRTFGPYRRYAFAPVHTRFGAVQWFVWDAETTDLVTNEPSIIRQEDTLTAALAGLPAYAGEIA